VKTTGEVQNPTHVHHFITKSIEKRSKKKAEGTMTEENVMGRRRIRRDRGDGKALKLRRSVRIHWAKHRAKNGEKKILPTKKYLDIAAGPVNRSLEWVKRTK